MWSVPDKRGNNCSSAETAWSVRGRAAKGSMGCSGISMRDKLLHWLKLCNSANGEMTEFRWIELGGSVSLVWRSWEQFSLEHSTQCRIQVMKGILNTSFSRRNKEGKTLHMLCSPNKSKIFFISSPMSLLLNKLKFAWSLLKWSVIFFVLFSTIQKWFLWEESKVSYFSFTVDDSWHRCSLSMPRNGSHSIFFTLSAMCYHKDADISFFWQKVLLEKWVFYRNCIVLLGSGYCS